MWRNRPCTTATSWRLKPSRARNTVRIATRRELRLDSRRVNAVRMQTQPHLSRELHVPVRPFALDVVADLDVQRRHEIGVAKLPDVQVVAAEHARERLNVFDDVVDGHSSWRGLEEDARGCFAERDGGAEDYDCDDERNAWVDVVAPGVVCKPDYEGGGDDADVSQGVTQDVEEHATHVEIVRVAAGLFLSFGLGVVVVVVEVVAISLGRF